VNRGVADTSVCDAREAGRPLVELDLQAQSAISVIKVGELQVGVLAAANIETRDRRLATLTQALAPDPLPIDRSVAESSARLRVMRRDSGLRMSVNESWIAEVRSPMVGHSSRKTMRTWKWHASRSFESEFGGRMRRRLPEGCPSQVGEGPMGPRPQRKSVDPAAYLITPMGVPARFSRRWRSGPVDPRAGPGEGVTGLRLPD